MARSEEGFSGKELACVCCVSLCVMMTMMWVKDLYFSEETFRKKQGKLTGNAASQTLGISNLKDQTLSN